MARLHSSRRVAKSASRSVWGMMAPKPEKQRQSLRKKCGTKCFLRPEDNGFPVCSARTRGCGFNCKGLFAARARAIQYNYGDIEKKADALIKKHCSYTSPVRKSVRKTRRSVTKSVRKPRQSARKSVRNTRKASRKVSRKARKSVRKSRRSDSKSVRKSRRSDRKSVRNTRRKASRKASTRIPRRTSRNKKK
jgi:hypothetical protein